MRGLTNRQTEVLEFITGHIERNGYAPSIREIGDAIHVRSSSTVHAHLTRLERAGHISRNGHPRSITVKSMAGTEYLWAQMEDEALKHVEYDSCEWDALTAAEAEEEMWTLVARLADWKRRTA